MWKIRVVTWNLQWRTGQAAEEQGQFLASLRPDLLLAQEVNANSFDRLVTAAGLDWGFSSLDLREALPSDRGARHRGCAIAGRGLSPATVRLMTDVPVPERLLVGRIPVGPQTLTVVSYHAPPGVSWHEKKPQQAVTFAGWLAQQRDPALLGADANTPEIDHPDFALTRTHWHTGHPKLNGAPGDDVLFGPEKVHDLDDALRRWLDNHPAERERIRRERPAGPLAASHYTGKRRDSPGTPRRFDSVWVSKHFEVESVRYLYEQAVRAGSDHAAVCVDLRLVSQA